MTYNPENAISLLEDVNPYTHDLIHLGNKGFNLIILTEDKKQIPPAFVITTEVFRCREVIFGFSKARQEFMQQIRRALTDVEEQTGKVFGSSEKPLLLSVRSGSAISMPGMMATVHNVGQNADLVQEFIKAHGNEYFAWDNYRRFLQSWAMISGVEREDFQELMDEAKARHNVALKRQFTPEQMKELALNYQKLVRQRGLGIPDDPWLQLIGAVEMVLDSWDNQKAIDYRRIMDVSPAWGTAVIVQAMVFGNRSEGSGSGVLFTAHPYRKVQRVALWGDYAYQDQGEDIVSGLVTSHPISIEQAELDGRSPDETLEIRFPEIYQKLLSISRELVYDKRWSPQEIEFTFEGPDAEDLYILQTRDMITIKQKELLNVFADSADLEKSILAKGIGVSGSAMSGKAVFTSEDIALLRAREPETPLILIRQDTVPEDITIISLTDGLLTSRGGQTSHASVVAVRLEKTCVVGCQQLRVYERYAEVDGHRLEFGDDVSIDGRNGLLLKGGHPVREEMHILPI
jgi:pyruvate,orthophosphate dikinase